MFVGLFLLTLQFDMSEGERKLCVHVHLCVCEFLCSCLYFVCVPLSCIHVFIKNNLEVTVESDYVFSCGWYPSIRT